MSLLFIAGDNNCEDDNSSRPPSAAIQTFCKAPRPQTAVSSQVTQSSRQRRPISCHPKLRFQDKENYYKREANDSSAPSIPPTSATKSRRSTSAKSHRSCWLSPLEMCNVPPDVKLKYIATEEKKRFSQMMSHTSRLLRNETTPLQWNDKLVRELMAYKPQLDAVDTSPVDDPEAKAKAEKEWAHKELSNILEASKNDPLLEKIIKDLATNIETKRLRSLDDNSDNVSDSVKNVSVNPVLLGSQTSKALMAGFYILMKDIERES